MNRVLVCYGSSEGQTATVAERIADELSERGNAVTLAHAKHAPEDLSVSAYDGVVVGASVHFGKHQSFVADFVRKHLEELHRGPSAFFSVSLTAAQANPDSAFEARQYVDEFLEETGWNPDITATFGGALRYREYGLMKRFVMKRIAGRERMDTDTSRDHEYTDWGEVEGFVEEFAALV